MIYRPLFLAPLRGRFGGVGESKPPRFWSFCRTKGHSSPLLPKGSEYFRKNESFSGVFVLTSLRITLAPALMKAYTNPLEILGLTFNTNCLICDMYSKITSSKNKTKIRVKLSMFENTSLHALLYSALKFEIISEDT